MLTKRLQMQNAFVVNITYFIIITFVKMSILLSYLRTFTESRLFRYTVWGILFVLVTSHVSLLILFIINVMPITCAWRTFQFDEDFDASCHFTFSYQIFLRLIIFSAALTVALDIIIVALPFRPVWRLHLPKRQKVAILLIMGSGIMYTRPQSVFLKWTSTHVIFSVTIGSILRLKYIIDLFWGEGDGYVYEWQVNFIR